MVDAALIKQCADPGLKLAIVEKFIERAGSPDPLTVTVRSGNRIILVPRPNTVEEAMELIRQNLGRNVTRVGITQYPAGLGILEAGQLKPDLVDTCENIRMGTALFAKVYRIVVKWYGNPVDEAFDDAIIAWQTGYFEGTAVFKAPDPKDVNVAGLKEAEPAEDTSEEPDESSRGPFRDEAAGDPNKANIRVDLSGIGNTKP
ncbi:conjugal transfer protein TraH [Ensifer sp. ENS02]|uniref:TraH family protein n=1 Tax=Ensifer sp. ENS02 TaxID=2769290 RepID=UPI001780B77E|nr:TraH family protein [Ensifer sp. ENS02]MBD9524652.1 conjugal transfer protein TraH [Ensifer sp. ENS02]